MVFPGGGEGAAADVAETLQRIEAAMVQKVQAAAAQAASTEARLARGDTTLQKVVTKVESALGRL